MNIRLKQWLFILPIAAAALGAFFGTTYYRHRFIRSDADMLQFLPHRDTTIFFANASVLRRSGMLRFMVGSKTTEEPSYTNFVRETHFDYTRDVDAVAGAANQEGVFFVVRGRFDWDRLRRYAADHGGGCKDGLCTAPTSRVGQWASFLSIQPDVLALAVSRSASAARALTHRTNTDPQSMPSEPVWVSVSPGVLRNPASLPAGARIFAISLQSAESVLLALGPSRSTGAAFELDLDAQFSSAAAADTARAQLELDTKMLKMELAREHEQPNPANLTGLLVAGTFQVLDTRLLGRWPVRRELLESLE